MTVIIRDDDALRRDDETLERGFTPGVFGRELMIDMAGCDPRMVGDTGALTEWTSHLVDEIGMTAYGVPIVARFGEGELFGNTVIQLITTSNVTVHANDNGTCHVNIFSCREFSVQAATMFTLRAFRPRWHVVHDLLRAVPAAEVR